MAEQAEGVHESVVYRPSPVLRPFLETCHGYRHDRASPGVHRGLPSSALTVVLAFEQPLDVGWFEEPNSRDRFWTLASGLHTRPADIYENGTQFGIQLGLTATGVRAILGVPMGALASGLVDMADLLPTGFSGWYDAIAGEPTWSGRFRQLESVLLRLTALHAGAPVERVRPELTWAWSRIEATGGKEPVGALAHQLGWSRRHLQSLFSDEFGVSPKQAARIVRFQRSMVLFTTGGGLGDVAAACGYSDQAHLTREWRSLTGYSPWQWMRVEFPFVQDRDLVVLAESGYA